MQSFFGSWMPAARMATLFGTQYQNAALRVVPPSCAAFSRTRTLLPCPRLNKAVASPATPLPTAMMSTSASNLPLALAGAADLRGMLATRRPPLVQLAGVCRRARRRSFKILEFYRKLKTQEDSRRSLPAWAKHDNISASAPGIVEESRRATLTRVPAIAARCLWGGKRWHCPPASGGA